MPSKSWKKSKRVVVTLDYVLEGEHKRFRDAITRLRSHVDALEDYIEQHSPTASARQAVTNAATQVSNHAAAIDALTFIGTEREVR